MTYFQYCKMMYDRGFATQAQLKVWVKAGRLTATNFKTITGNEYEA